MVSGLSDLMMKILSFFLIIQNLKKIEYPKSHYMKDLRKLTRQIQISVFPLIALPQKK